MSSHFHKTNTVKCQCWPEQQMDQTDKKHCTTEKFIKHMFESSLKKLYFYF